MKGAINARLLALLAGGVAATVAGVSVVVFVPSQGVTRADLLDAGIVAQTNPRRLSCWTCGDLCDGGGCCQRSTIVAVARTLPSDGGDREVIFPRSALRFRAALDQFDERSNCRVTDSTWDDVADFGTDPAEEEPPCRCRARADAGTCRTLDGGPLVLAQTYEPEAATGACVPTMCGGPAGSEPLSEACR